MSRIIRPEKQQPSRIPILGKIKIGMKVKKDGSDREYPVSLDYFIAAGKFKSYFDKAYPGKPSKIQIFFHTNDIDEVCTEKYELRDDKGKLAAYGNGESYFAWNAKEEKYLECDKEGMKKSGLTGRWSTTLTLRFIIPKIPGVFGVWQLITKGDKSSIPTIVDTFDSVKNRAGTIINIPFDLIVEKVKSQKPGQKSVYPVITLIPNLSDENMEVVRNFLTSGGNIQELGKLTTDKISQLAPESKQLPEGTDKPVVKSKPVEKKEEKPPPGPPPEEESDYEEIPI